MEKKNYNYIKCVKVGDTVVGHVEGWTYARDGKPLLSSFTYGNEGKEGYAIKINGQYNQKELEYFFGENIKKCISQKGYLIIDVVGFDQLKGLKAYNPTLQQLLGFTGTLKLEETTSNGKTYYGLKMTAVGFKPVTPKKEEAGRIGTSNGVSQDFEEVDDDGDMPF